MTSFRPMSPEEAKKYHEKRAREISRHASDGYVELSFIIELEGMPLDFLEKDGVLVFATPVPQGEDELRSYLPSNDWSDRIRTGKLIPLFIKQRSAKELVDRWRASGEIGHVVAPASAAKSAASPDLPRQTTAPDPRPPEAARGQALAASRHDSSPAGLLTESPIPAGVATVVSLVSLHHYLTEDFASAGYALVALILLVVPGMFVLSGSKDLLGDRLVTWIKYTVGVAFVWFVVLRTPMRGL